MVTVNGTCVVCGEVTFDVHRVSLVSYAGARPQHCLWQCPHCNEPRLQPVDRHVQARLRAAGARLLVIPVEPRKPGALDLDYVIDINNDLEQL